MSSVVINGITIHYQVEGSGPPLVMLGGFPGSVEDMYDFGYVGALRDDFQLILIDQRGFGKSDKPHSGEAYSLGLILEDILAVLEHLEVEQCHIYGHSMGGWYLYGMAKYHAERLLSMIISDGVPGSEDPELLREILGAFEAFIQSIEGLNSRQKERFLRNDLEALRAMADWVEREHRELIEMVDGTSSEIKVPCLVLASNLPEKSDEFRLLHKTVKENPQAEFVQFNELSHIDLFLRGDLVLPEIKRFLAKVSAL